MKGNFNKCDLLLSKNENFEANISENRISNTRLEKLLIINSTLITIFPKLAKHPIINFMNFIEFPTTSMKIKGE